MMRKPISGFKKLLSTLLAIIMLTSLVPTQVLAAGANSLVESLNTESWLENNAIHVDVSKNSGAFYIRTVNGDKLVKGDEYANLLWPSENDTSFTTVRITRNGETKDYIFGKNYDGTNTVAVTNDSTQIEAVWTVDDVTFTQTIRLQPSNNDAHGMVAISYTAVNNGAAADIGVRVLLDTAMGGKDYAYYNIGEQYALETERELGVDGYDKSIYMMDDPSDPLVTGYILNGSVDGAEKKPVKTVIAHWANLASTIYDYTPDTDLYFTNAFNARHLTSDSAVALYYSLGTVVPNAAAYTSFNYGLYSNEKVKGYQVAVNLQTIDALSYADETEMAFENEGKFTAKTILQNASRKTYSKVRVFAYASGGIQVLNSEGQDHSGDGKAYGYENPYYVELNDFAPGQKANNMSLWNFQATMDAEANYGRIHFKIYDMSNNNSDTPYENDLIGEVKKYILVPGSMEKLPNIQLTGSSPEVFHTEGHRVFNVTGMKFAGLEAEAEDRFTLKLYRRDGGEIRDGATVLTLPPAAFTINQDGTGMMTVTIDGELPQGEYRITIDYTDPERADIDAKALEFQIIDDTRYRCETYGYVAVYHDEDADADGRNPKNNYRVMTFKDESMYNEWKDDNNIDESDVLMIFKGVFDDLTDSLPQDALDALKKDETYACYLSATLSEDAYDTVIMSNALEFSSNGPGSNVVIKQIQRVDDGVEKQSVKVDMNCTIKTAGAGTLVFDMGVSCFTELKAGTRYKLIEYDDSGERNDTVGDPIAMIWPGYGTFSQTILGAVFNFRYGELGIMDDGNGGSIRTVGFGGGLDLSCIIPKSADEYIRDEEWSVPDECRYNPTPDEQRDWDEWHKQYRESRNNFKDRNMDRADYVYNQTDFYDDDDNINFSGSVQVSDILFGARSFLGFNISVGVGIPPLAYGMPAVQGVFTLRTIGQVEFRVNGSMRFWNFELEALLDLKSNDTGILIPDEFKFFIGGVTPGLNLDPFGVLWLQGGGGGIKDIYETIYLQDKVPPIKLILQAQFSLLQVMSAKATVELGLTGIGLGVSDVRITATDIVVLDSAVVAMRWYPNIALLGSVQVDLLHFLKGGGYMVGYINYDFSNPFFEFFVRAAIHVPDNVPVIGGMTVADANFGISTERIFGSVHALGIGVGVSYYWRNELTWGMKNEASPTFPELLGLGQEFDTDIDEMFENIPTGKEDDGKKGGSSSNNTNSTRSIMMNQPEGVPVYYDRRNNRTLMAVAGTNLRKDNTVYTRDGAGEQNIEQNVLSIAPDGRTVNATFAPNGKSKVIMLTWDSASEAAAEAEAARISTGDFALVMLDHETDAAKQPNANANLSCAANDDGTVRATLSISVTDASVASLNITSPVSVDAVLLEVDPLPELRGCTASLDGTELTVNLSGSKLDSFDYVNVALVEKNDLLAANAAENAVPTVTMVGRIEKDENGHLPTAAQTIELPADLPSGEYVVRLMAQDEAQTQISQADLTTNLLSFTNPNTPSDPFAVDDITSAGDWKVNVPILSGTANDFDGYEISVTDADGNGVSGLTELMYYRNGEAVSYTDDGKIKAPDVNTDAGTITIGGHVEVPVSDTINEEDGTMTADENTLTETKVIGFSAGNYTVSVRKWKSADGVPVYSGAVTKTFRVSAPAPANVAITGSSTVFRTEQRGNDTVDIPYYTDDQLIFTLTSDKPVSGAWVIDSNGVDDGYSFEVENSTEVTIDLRDFGLDDGVHSVTFSGKTAAGDTSNASYAFGIDNGAPSILISSPVNGGEYNGTTGEITITGVTDPDAILTIYDQTTGTTITPVVTIDDSTGGFTATATLDVSSTTHQIKLIAVDDLGNGSERSFVLRSSLLRDIAELHLYEGETEVTEQKLTAGTHTLSIVGKTANGTVVKLTNPSMIEWDVQTLEGSAITSSLSADGMQLTITAADDSVGIVTVKMLVNEDGSYPVSCMIGSTLSVSTDEITVEAGKTAPLGVSSKTGTALTYTSGDTTVATVQTDEDGMAVVTGVNAGTTTVTVTAATGETATVNVTVVEELTYTVTIEADNGCTVTVVANYDEENGGTAIHSGDRVAYGTVLTYTITPKSGFTLTTSPASGTITVEDNVTITANSEEKTYTVTPTATEGGAAPTQDPANPVPYGTKVKLTAGAASEGYTFIGWFQTNGKLLTENAEYTVTVTGDVTYEARYQKNSGVVTFMANGNVQKTVTKDSVTADDFPADPTPLNGYEFTGWDKTVEEINADLSAGKSVTVTAKFKQIEKTITVMIYNGLSNTPTEDTIDRAGYYTVTAQDVADKVFAYWEQDGKARSYKKKASFFVTDDTELRAYYTDEAVTAVGTANILKVTYNEEAKKLVFNSYLTTPANTTIVKAGLVASRTHSDDLTWDNADYKKSLASAEGKSGNVSYTWTKSSVNPSDVWYVKAYVLYEDGGVQYPVYGELMTAVAGEDYDSSEKGTASITSSRYDSSSKKAIFVSYLTTPEKATIVKSGLVAAQGGENKFDPTAKVLTAATANYVKSLATAEGKSGNVTYTWTKTKVESGDIWYVRAYLVYTDGNGREHTVYGKLVKLTAGE